MIDLLFTIGCAIVVIGILVVIHEGGHFLAAKAFKVRVTELMIGLPGPSVGFVANGTRFGITAIPLGGYAKVCGMETGEVNPHLKAIISSVYGRGEASAVDVANDCGISVDDAQEGLDELIEWGTIMATGRRYDERIFQTPRSVPTKKQQRLARRLNQLPSEPLEQGTPRKIDDIDAFYDREYAQMYRSLPLWKKSVILLAGIAVNLIFAILAFIVIYSIVGIDVTNPQTNEITHLTISPLQSITAGFNVIGMTFASILNLFNPETAAETVSNSTSIVGIAVMSTDYFAQGFVHALFFMALISISLGLMNLLPIPPLDGGRFLIEIIQRVTKRQLSTRALGYISMFGMALFLCFFIFMLNQDIQRFVFGNW